jgi:hypothetical protein
MHTPTLYWRVLAVRIDLSVRFNYTISHLLKQFGMKNASSCICPQCIRKFLWMCDSIPCPNYWNPNLLSPRLPAVLDNLLLPGGAGWEPVLGVLLPVGAPSALVSTPLLSLASFRLTWESALRLSSPIVGLPLSCSPLHLTIHVISVSGNQTRV